MLATNSWVYLDLEKSGSTFLRGALEKIFGLESFVEREKHSLMSSASNLPRLMTVRDPFEYYFSLWSYGLDRKGGFFELISSCFPKLEEKLYAEKTPSCFAAFLDYTLNSPIRYPNNLRHDWLPFYFDLYTTRILSMIVPIDSRESFLESLGTDYPNHYTIIEAVSCFMPEILIRTKSLNSDFHHLADSGRLDFMKLPGDWKQVFPIQSCRVNASSSLFGLTSSDEIALHPFWMPGWRSVVESKSSLSLWMIGLASSRL